LPFDLAAGITTSLHTVSEGLTLPPIVVQKPSLIFKAVNSDSSYARRLMYGRTDDCCRPPLAGRCACFLSESCNPLEQPYWLQSNQLRARRTAICVCSFRQQPLTPFTLRGRRRRFCRRSPPAVCMLFSVSRASSARMSAFCSSARFSVAGARAGGVSKVPWVAVFPQKISRSQ